MFLLFFVAIGTSRSGDEVGQCSQQHGYHEMLSTSKKKTCRNVYGENPFFRAVEKSCPFLLGVVGDPKAPLTS
eukprot:m.40127 g.40127  ORF g.40127 m.40127 type:complete len:73 (-) comp14782_c0_seq5:130-348(-)